MSNPLTCANTHDERAAIVARLLAAWDAHPELRLGQLISASVMRGERLADRDVFDTPDNALAFLVERTAGVTRAPTPNAMRFLAAGWRRLAERTRRSLGAEQAEHESVFWTMKRALIAWEAGMPDTIGSMHCCRTFSRCAYTYKVNR